MSENEQAYWQMMGAFGVLHGLYDSLLKGEFKSPIQLADFLVESMKQMNERMKQLEDALVIPASGLLQ